jgi:nitrite reductase (NADH) large subunit
VKIVTVGTGMAAAEFVDVLRREKSQDEIVMISNEISPPYSPCVLPFFLAGEPLETVYWKGENFYHDKDVTAKLGAAVVEVDSERHCVRLENGQTEGYDRLLFAAGAESWYPHPQWLDTAGVFGFKTLTDMLAIDQHIKENDVRRVVVFGGGFIGVDAALSLWHRGLEVILVHRNTRVLSQMTDEDGGIFATQKLREITGIDIRLRAMVDDIKTNNGALEGVELSTGESLATTMLVVAIGVSPNSRPLDGQDDGIQVDDTMRADPHIYATGDVAVTAHAVTSEKGIYATYPNAMLQARTAARHILHGEAHYPGSINTNVLKKHIEFPIISAGSFSGEAVTWQNQHLFRRVYLVDGRINGYQLIGDTRISGYIYNLYRSQVRVDSNISSILADNRGDSYYRSLMGFNKPQPV